MGCIDLWIALGIMEILTILCLSVHKHRLSFHLLLSSLISFNNVFLVFSIQFFTSLVKFIPKYFILFDAVSNVIAFLISF